MLLAFAIVPFLVAGSWRIVCAGRRGSLAAALPLAAWSVHNGIRFDTWALARGGNAIVPFYRAFITDHIISPENGENSRRLAAAMREHLLTRDPYRSYGVTLDGLFERGSFRVHEDLYLLSDEVFGWNSDYEILRKPASKACAPIQASTPAAWRERCGTSCRRPNSESSRHRRAKVDAGAKSRPTVVVNGKRLPAPTEGEPIPSGQVVWISRPDNSIRQVWTSPTEWHFEFARASERPRFERIERRTQELFDALPDRAGNARLALRLNQLSRWFPRPWMWILLGLIAIGVRRPRGWPFLVAQSLAAFAVVFLNALGLFADLHFVLPVAPAFVLLGLAGLLGIRGPRTVTRRIPTRTTTPSSTS